MASFPDGVGPGLFLPTTEILDVQQFVTDNLTADQLQELLIRIVQAFNDVNQAVNLKDTGIYSEAEFVNGQVFFPNPTLSSLTAQAPTQRQVFRKVINSGALQNAGTTTVAHGITVDASTTFTRIYGAASDVGASKEYLPLPFVDVTGTVAAGNVELHVDGTNVLITTTGDGTNFTVSYVILEYIKQ